MNTLGPIAQLPQRELLSPATRWEYRQATPEMLESAIQRLPPDASEAYRSLRRMQEEILVWRRKLNMRRFAG